MEGWIKTYRVLLDWEWHDVPAMMTLWIHLLLLANNKDREWHGSKIRRGQFATSLASLSSMTGLSVKQIRTCLQRLKDSNQIVTERANKFTIITICKFDTYQPCEQGEGQTNGNEKASKGHGKGTERASEGQQLKNIRKKEDKNNITPSNEGESVDTDPSVDVDLKSVVEFFNKSVVECGSVLPKIKGATGKRVGYIKARIREFGLEAVYEVISKAAASDFLNGKNQRGWVASFDWIMLPTNFPKVLEGNYDNRNNHYQPQINGTNQFTDPRQAEREQLARGYAAVVARRLAEDDAREAELRQP